MDNVDASGTGVANKNFDNKNTYVKAGVNIYNIANVNMGNIIDTRDVNDTDCKDNNINNKNAYAKTDFSIYTITNTNIDVNPSDISGIVEKDSNNTNNICISQLSKVDGTDKDG